MPRLLDLHTPAGTFLGSWCWHSVPSLGTQLEGSTTDKLAKDSCDEKQLKKSVRATKQEAVKRPRPFFSPDFCLWKNRSTFELSHKFRILTDSQAQTPNFDGHADRQTHTHMNIAHPVSTFIAERGSLTVLCVQGIPILSLLIFMPSLYSHSNLKNFYIYLSILP